VKSDRDFFVLFLLLSPGSSGLSGVPLHHWE